jgi:hypothetical protein
LAGRALTLHASTVTANTVSLAPTNGFLRYGTGGGIESFGSLTIDGSTVSHNTVGLANASTDPASTTVAIGGGIHIDASAAATIRGSVFQGNAATVTGYAGFVSSTAGAIDDDGSLVLTGSKVSNNRSAATVTSTLTSPTSQANGGAMEIEGSATIAGTTFSGNNNISLTPGANEATSFNFVRFLLCLNPPLRFFSLRLVSRHALTQTDPLPSSDSGRRSPLNIGIDHPATSAAFMTVFALGGSHLGEEIVGVRVTSVTTVTLHLHQETSGKNVRVC